MWIGQFRCTPDSELWRTENLTGEYPIVVFPRTAVTIEQSKRAPVVANPNNVMFYDPFHTYRRRVVDPRGDLCEFYAIAPDLLDEALSSAGSPPSGSDSTFFGQPNGPCQPKNYLAQRALFSHIQSKPDVDAFFVEEITWNILSKVILETSQFYRNRRKVPADKKPNKNRELIEEAIELLARRHRTAITLDDVARHVDLSVYHLCRVFKQHTGFSMHQYLSHFRLRTAIEKIYDSRRTMTDIALDYCYSSHSHFTNSFRRMFGVSPSQLRKSDAMNLLEAIESN